MRSLVLLAACCLTALAAHAAEPLRVVSVPWLAPETLQKLYAPTVELLHRKLNRPMQYITAKDYSELTERVTARAADIAFYGPAGYVTAKKRYPGIRYLATCLLPDDHYFSLIFARKSAALSRITDAKGHSIGFTDKQSTSGYLIPRLLFSRAGIRVEQDMRLFLLGHHYRVFDAVAQGAVEVGAAESGAWANAVTRHGDIFRVLAKSTPIPRDPVAAAPHVDDLLARKIQKILAEAHLDPVFVREVTELKGYSIRSDQFYDPVREISP